MRIFAVANKIIITKSDEQMENSTRQELNQSTQTAGTKPAKGVFTGPIGDVITKVICIVFAIAALVAGIWSGTWHNVMFAGMFYCVYRAVRYEEDK